MEKHHHAILHAAHVKGMSEVQAMNLLQNFGIISDLCVWIADIPKEDAIRAEEFILKHEATK